MQKKRSSKAGLPPGSPVHVGDTNPETSKITIIDYTPKKLKEKTVRSVRECLPFKNSKTITWINIGGLPEASLCTLL
jgi:magnesium transporter